MKKNIIDNLKRIIALLLVVTMTMSQNISVFAEENAIKSDSEPVKELEELDLVEESTGEAKAGTLNNMTKPASEPEFDEENTDKADADMLGSTPEPVLELVPEQKNIGKIKARMLSSTPEPASDSAPEQNYSDEEAREIECISGYNGKTNPDYLKKFLTYLSLKYPEIGINPKYGDGANTDDSISNDNELKNWYNAAKMGRQRKYETIEINGNDTFEGYPNLTKNMVQFRYLGNFDGSIGGTSGNNDTVKTLIIRNVDEIRNLYVPEFVETLIIENTTINCYESPGFQCDSYGDLKNCRNLKKLVLKNVKFGDNYKNPDREVGTWGKYGYETHYRLNLQNCYNLEELEISVSFEGAQEIQLAIDGGTDNLFEKLSDEKCKINPAPGTGYEQVNLYANANSYLAKRYNSSEGVKFENGQFRLWLLDAIGVDSNNDGVISQAELDAIKTLTINNQTAHSAKQTSLSAFYELADISKMHGLKSLEIDFYDPDYSNNANRHPLKGIDFPDYLENLTIKNVYWEKDTQTKSHDNADIVLTNLKTLELYNTDVKVSEGASYFNHPTQIKLTDTEGVLQSCIIEKTDVESIELINNSTGKGIKNQDEKQRIRFSASECQNLQSIEFLGEGYAVEGSLDLTNDTALKHIGIPNAGKTQWTVYGEFDSTYAPINVILNSCSSLGSDGSEIVIDYDFINGRDINVQTMNTSFNAVNMLTIKRIPRIPSDTAGKVYLSCDTGSWVYSHYENEPGFVIENRSSFPTIAVFADGQRIRTNGEGNHNNDSEYTEDTDHFVERWDLVMPPYGYSNNFGNLTFYVVDKTVDGAGNRSESLRKVFYGSTGNSVYVEWEQQEHADTIITLPTVKDETGGYKLTGAKLSSTGTPGEVTLKLYVLQEENGNTVKSYIGYQNIKIFKMPDSVELVNDGTARGSGTKDDPYIVDKNEELKLKARLKVNGGVDQSGNYALRDVYWRIKEYDETPKYTSDSDGYSLYTLDSATKAGIEVVRGELNNGETEAQYDRRIDNIGSEPTYFNHRRFTFDTAGSKFKIVAQSPYKYRDSVISTEVYVVYNNSDNPGGGNSGSGNSGGGNSGGGNSAGGNSAGEKTGDENSSGGNYSVDNPTPSMIPVYNTIPIGAIPVGTVVAGTIPVYNTIPVDPIKDPKKPTLGVPVIEKKNPGVYVMPDPTKNEVVYMAPPADNTKKTINIPDKIVISGKEMLVVKIDPGAFKNNEIVETIKIGKNIKVIGSGAFEGATNLKKITLGKNVEIIGDGAFKDCISLTSITLPSNITNIGFGVFGGCINLRTIKITSKKLTSIGVAVGAFNGLTEKTTIKVPWSKLKTYKMLFEEKGINSTVKIKRY